MKGLRAYIYDDKVIGNCSNGGISVKCKVVTIVGLGKSSEVFEPDDEAPAVKIVARRLFGGEPPYLTAYPVEPSPKDQTGYMFGGTFIWSSDSRFPGKYPIPLHDRTDTWELYNQLSK